jgi:hypothetical protein
VSATANELLAVMGARELRDNTTVFTGVWPSAPTPRDSP